MSYWNMQLHPNNLGWNREIELLKKHSVIGLGDWEEAAKQQPNFEHTMKVGDYVMIKHGGSIIALVQVVGNYYNDDRVDDLLWFQRRRKVKVLDWYQDDYHYYVTPRKTLERCANPNTEMYKSIVDWIKRIKKENNMNNIAKLLESNHNLILTGAPGTGKTYLAKQLACLLITGKANEAELSVEVKKQFDEQFGFVQFHPSYDYTDFVEGMRPTEDKNEGIGFERKDGIFKLFCKKALKSYISDSSDNYEEVWGKLIEYLNENEKIEIPLVSGSRKINIELNEYGTGLTERSYITDTNDGSKEKIKGHSKFFTKEQLYNIYRGLKGVPSGGHDNYRRAIIEYMKRELGLIEYSEGHKTDEERKYVFVIDEINRGEISKIFGELFFSIDPGYRGKHGRVKTQYQNLIDDGDEFFDGFYVPENVYIIGTMNDIDRSVESMDFAFRRRFAFKEITAESRQQMLYEEKAWGEDKEGNSLMPSKEEIENIKNRMNNLNRIIWHEELDGEDEAKRSIDGLSSAYHIGASYFLKIANYKNDDGTYDYEKLWDNHLNGLLMEYMRGMPNIHTDIHRLKEAYNDTNDHENEQADNNG